MTTPSLNLWAPAASTSAPTSAAAVACALVLLGVGLALPLPAAPPKGGEGAHSAHIATDAHHGIVIESIWSRATPPGAKIGAVYLALRNPGVSADALISAKSAAAERIEIHSMSLQNGKMAMRQLSQLQLSPGKTTRLEPGGTHLMLLGLKHPLEAGNTLTLTLKFASGHTATVDAPVAPLGASQPPSPHPH